MLHIRCPNSQCSQAYQIHEESLGGQGTCQSCGTTFRLQLAGDAVPPAPSNSVGDNWPPTPPAQAGPPEPQPVSPPIARPIPVSSLPMPVPSNTQSPPVNLPTKLGRFQIRGLLGAGAFGTVYRAHDPMLDREVALKVPHTTAVQDEQSAARFLREARAAAQLRHPNIVPIYDAGFDDGHLYIASAFIEGHTLEAAIKARRIDLHTASQIVRELADALAYAHAQGIVHRDIKPANIMLDAQGKPHLMDFGLARLASEREKLSHDGSILGTPAYMSPEQADGESTTPVGPPSDQYSLGVVLYELLCGERPFEGPVEVVIFNVLKTEPPTAASLNPKVPKDLDTICQKAMTKEPGRRYLNCRALSEDLRRWQDDEPIAARRVSQVERVYRWIRRNPVVASLTAAVILVLTVGIVATTLFALDARREAAARAAALAETQLQRDRADQEAKLAHLKTQEAIAQKQRTAAALADVQQQSDRADREARLAQLKTKESLAEKQRADEEARRAAAQERTSAKRRYNAQISRVQQLWEDGQVSAAWDQLQACRWDLRGWEHNYLYTRFARGNLVGHRSRVTSVAFSPDGRRIVSGSHDKTLKVWDAATGDETLTLKGHADRVTSVAFSPDGRRIVSGSDDKTLKVWDAATGEETLTFNRHTDNVTSVAFSPDGRWIVSGSGGILKVWDAATGDEALTLRKHTHDVTSVAFSPDGRRIVSGSHDNTLKIWDATTGQQR